jgi:hypothetical protein
MEWDVVMEADKSNPHPSSFWFNIFEYQAQNEVLYRDRLTLKPGEQKKYHWEYKAPHPMVLESNAGIDEDGGSATKILKNAIMRIR